MNKEYIGKRLDEMDIVYYEFFWANAGPALRFGFIDGVSRRFLYRNFLIPLDDESDERFAQFVAAEYRRLMK